MTTDHRYRQSVVCVCYFVILHFYFHDFVMRYRWPIKWFDANLITEILMLEISIEFIQNGNRYLHENTKANSKQHRISMNFVAFTNECFWSLPFDILQVSWCCLPNYRYKMLATVYHYANAMYILHEKCQFNDASMKFPFRCAQITAAIYHRRSMYLYYTSMYSMRTFFFFLSLSTSINKDNTETLYRMTATCLHTLKFNFRLSKAWTMSSA